MKIHLYVFLEFDFKLRVAFLFVFIRPVFVRSIAKNVKSLSENQINS